MMTCKGICDKFKVKSRYAYGRRCGICAVFISWEVDNNCPCCHGRLGGARIETEIESRTVEFEQDEG